MKNVMSLCFFIVTINTVVYAQQWTTSGSNIYNANAGNVGIGTTTPAKPLEIALSSGNSGNTALNVTLDPTYNANRASQTVSIPATIGANDYYGMSLYNDGWYLGTALVSAEKIVSWATFSPEEKSFKIAGYTNNYRNYALELKNNNTTLSNPNNYWHYRPNTSTIIAWEKPLSIGTNGHPFRMYADNFSVNKVADIYIYNQKVGIGTETPLAKFDVAGNMTIGTNASAYLLAGTDGNNNPFIRSNQNPVLIGSGNNYLMAVTSSNVGIGTTTPHADAKLDVNGNIFSNGKIIIGTTDAAKYNGYSLAVNGHAIFTKIKVEPYLNWPDYVFEEKYDLLPLSHVAAFIAKYKHLPGVPSAKEVEANGIDIGDNQALLLKKIEELTLYSIGLEQKNSEQEQRILLLEKEGEASNQKFKELEEKIEKISRLLNSNILK